MQNERNNVLSVRRPEYCNRELYMKLTVGLHVYMLQPLVNEFPSGNLDGLLSSSACLFNTSLSI